MLPPRSCSAVVLFLVAACGDSGAPNPPAVTVTAVTPATGTMAGGTGVTITGTNFTNVTSVTIGGSELGSRTVVSATEITGTTPSSTSAGAKDVVVTSSTHGSATCSACFSYGSSGFLVALVAGHSHTCGLTGAGVAICWGWNGLGQLGNGSTTSSSVPVPVSGGLSFSALASGTGHTCGLTSFQTAHCWGRNGEGQLGIATATGPETCNIPIGGGDEVPEACSTVPVTVIGGLGFHDLTTGGWNTAGLTSAGAAYMWGLNDYGQLGNGSTTNSPSPVAVSGGQSFRALTTGTSRGHTCGLTSAGSAYCWGANSTGQLGDGSTTNSLTPVAVAGGLAFSALAAGGPSGTSSGHTCGLTSSGAAYCWGDNSSGQLGDGSTTNRSTPIPVSGGLSFSALAAGMVHTCGLTSAGLAYCWGLNLEGQLGDGTTTNSSTPVAVSGGLNFSAVAAGILHTCGLTSAGAAYCWGWNSDGQLGNGSTANSAVPVRVVGQIP